MRTRTGHALADNRRLCAGVFRCHMLDTCCRLCSRTFGPQQQLKLCLDFCCWFAGADRHDTFLHNMIMVLKACRHGCNLSRNDLHLPLLELENDGQTFNNVHAWNGYCSMWLDWGGSGTGTWTIPWSSRSLASLIASWRDNLPCNLCRALGVIIAGHKYGLQLADWSVLVRTMQDGRLVGLVCGRCSMVVSGVLRVPHCCLCIQQQPTCTCYTQKWARNASHQFEG